MRKIFFSILIVSIFSFTYSKFRVIPNTCFEAGESYEYKVKYGFLNIGSANVDVDDMIYQVGNRPCYKVNVFGRTTGLTDVFRVRNTYRSYIDTAAFLPMKFIYSARENNYKRDNFTLFNHVNNSASMTEKDNTRVFNVPDNIQDLISGYYLLRTVDFSKYAIGQAFTAPLFFDEDVYYLKVKYAGKGVAKTKYGKINVLKLNPILPKNEMFHGENAIRIWISDDKNRVPIKIEADFSFGTIELELKNYQGVKYPLSWN